ncbi:MAG: hypothetical protein WCJ04_11840 [Actinomycetes bacterium]
MGTGTEVGTGTDVVVLTPVVGVPTLSGVHAPAIAAALPAVALTTNWRRDKRDRRGTTGESDMMAREASEFITRTVAFESLGDPQRRRSAELIMRSTLRQRRHPFWPVRVNGDD